MNLAALATLVASCSSRSVRVSPPRARLAALALASLAASLVPALPGCSGCGDGPASPPADAGLGDGAQDGGRRRDAAALCRRDADCDDGVFCNGRELCLPDALASDDRGCLPGRAACLQGQTCDEAMRRCVTDCGAATDADGDGEPAPECGGLDCDDADPVRYPSATEVCDAAGRDEDCNPATLGATDADGDGYVSAGCCNVQPDATRLCGPDCDDARAGVFPGATEVCNGLDDDCDGMIDEGVTRTFYPDADGDGYGARGGAPVSGCTPPAGHVENDADCDDTRRGVNPAAYDRCDVEGVDDDCNGVPNDPAGGCSCDTGATDACPLPGRCAGSTRTCVDGLWSDCGVAPVDEICGNGEDDDCDGAVDDGCPCRGGARRCGLDRGECRSGLQNCEPSGVWGDCEGAVGPEPERCNGLDDDCDGIADDDLVIKCYLDGDGDGFAPPRALWISVCSVARLCPPGTTDVDPDGVPDCNDANADVHPRQDMYFYEPYAVGTRQTWDYDCDGADTPRPDLRLVACVTDGSGGCDPASTDGYVDPLECGVDRQRFTCGSTGGGCVPVFTGTFDKIVCR
jgi:hypothetical protein